jgi:phosphoribosylformylglycinamidine cyclo-ligase
VNDILACGAKPLFFLDYFATGKLNPDVAEQIITGFVIACRENGCALIGGETAEMPSLYQDGEYDMSGTIVGLVDKNNITDGKSIKPGDVMIGLESSGLHTNGYSLARAVLFPKFQPDQYIDELQSTIGEALLKVHVSYQHTVMPLIEQKLVKGISHITGGGIIGNTSRILPQGTAMSINWDAWQVPAIFQLIQKEGNIEDDEMRRAFNMGIGMILVTDKANADKVMDMCKEKNPVVIGEIVKA